jgi:hypothetical protein
MTERAQFFARSNEKWTYRPDKVSGRGEEGKLIPIFVYSTYNRRKYQVTKGSRESLTTPMEEIIGIPQAVPIDGGVVS